MSAGPTYLALCDRCRRVAIRLGLLEAESYKHLRTPAPGRYYLDGLRLKPMTAQQALRHRCLCCAGQARSLLRSELPVATVKVRDFQTAMRRTLAPRADAREVA